MPSYKTRVFVHNRAIAGMNAPGGMVDRKVHRVADRTLILAVTDAPKRSGALAASVRVDREGSNQFGVNYRVSAGAGYASFVHEGTSGHSTGGVPGTYRTNRIGANGRPIYRWFQHPTGRVMRMYKGPRFVPARYAAFKNAQVYEVAGQLANPFLSRALGAAMRAEGL